MQIERSSLVTGVSRGRNCKPFWEIDFWKEALYFSLKSEHFTNKIRFFFIGIIICVFNNRKSVFLPLSTFLFVTYANTYLL